MEACRGFRTSGNVSRCQSSGWSRGFAIINPGTNESNRLQLQHRGCHYVGRAMQQWVEYYIYEPDFPLTLSCQTFDTQWLTPRARSEFPCRCTFRPLAPSSQTELVMNLEGCDEACYACSISFSLVLSYCRRAPE